MPIDNEEAAKRLAKTIMQDISLYNAEKIREGLLKDSMFDVLAEELNEGRNLFKSRVTPELFSRNIYERAINDFLIKDAVLRSKGQVESKIAA